MSVFLWYGAGDLADWVNVGGRQRLLQLSWLVSCGVLVYLLSLLALGVRPRHLKV